MSYNLLIQTNINSYLSHELLMRFIQNIDAKCEKEHDLIFTIDCGCESNEY